MAETSTTGQPGEEGRITTIEDLKQRQDAQESKLDRIVSLLEGDARSAERDTHRASQERVESRLERGTNIQDAMRQAIKDVDAERQQADAKAAHDAEHERLKTAKQPEQPPAEVAVSWKNKLQRGLFGGDR